jgi:hypothetical protein
MLRDLGRRTGSVTEEEYTMARKGEADPAQGRISTESPVAGAARGLASSFAPLLSEPTPGTC